MKLSKRDLKFLLIIIALIVFIIPFLFIGSNDKLTALSTAFTAVGAFATVFTAFIAITLFDKFGVDQKLAAKQMDKVIELVDLLKGKVMRVKAGIFNYLVRPSTDQLKTMKSVPFFKENSIKKLIVLQADYELGVKELLDIRKSYWLPKEIKEKIEFFEFPMLMNIEDNEMDNYVLLDFGTDSGGKVGRLFPEMTFQEFITKLYKLVTVIENWQKKNSSIIIDFKMEESENDKK
jgi:hypothetical protein